MDKALIEIKKLEIELQNINITKDTNEFTIKMKDNHNTLLNDKICKLQREINKLKKDKKKYEDSPGELKKLKKVSILKTILLTIIIMVMFIGTVLVSTSQIIPILSALGIGTILSSISGVMSFEKYKKLKEFVNNNSLSIINNDINTKEIELEIINKEYDYNEEIIEKLENQIEELEPLIPILKEKINDIKFIRSKVIEEFCKDNKELDIRIDNVYNEMLEQEQSKQKIKKI